MADGYEQTLSAEVEGPVPCQGFIRKTSSLSVYDVAPALLLPRVGYSRAISSLFFLEQKSLRVGNFRGKCLGHGYKATQSRYSFDAIKDLGLVTWIDPETSRPSWVVVLRLVDGSYRYLSFFTRDYSAHDAALTRICEATKIRIQLFPPIWTDHFFL
jgi:hypothetical protein